MAGLWVPIITPFTAEGAVDSDSLKRLATRLLDDGVHGLVALGTTGEAATLAAGERRHVVEVCAEACSAASRPLMVGAGTNSTASTIDEIVMLTEGLAVAAALIVVPYYVRPSELAVVEHFGTVADASPVSIVMYNVPYRTGQEFSAASLLEAAEHPNIIGLKQAVGALDRDTLELLATVDDDFAVLAGDDAFVVPTLVMGGSGAIIAAAHCSTPQFVEMVNAARAGQVDRAVELAESLLPVVTAGFAEPNPSVFKAALVRSGELASSYVRRPLISASEDAVDQLMRVI